MKVTVACLGGIAWLGWIASAALAAGQADAPPGSAPALQGSAMTSDAGPPNFGSWNRNCHAEAMASVTAAGKELPGVVVMPGSNVELPRSHYGGYIACADRQRLKAHPPSGAADEAMARRWSHAREKAAQDFSVGKISFEEMQHRMDSIDRETQTAVDAENRKVAAAARASRNEQPPPFPGPWPTTPAAARGWFHTVGAFCGAHARTYAGFLRCYVPATDRESGDLFPDDAGFYQAHTSRIEAALARFAGGLISEAELDAAVHDANARQQEETTAHDQAAEARDQAEIDEARRALLQFSLQPLPPPPPGPIHCDVSGPGPLTPSGVAGSMDCY